jgi:hypothetical protein
MMVIVEKLVELKLAGETEVLRYVTNLYRLNPGRGKIFCLLHAVQTGPGAHQGSYPMGTGALSPRVKRLGLETGHL